MAQRLYSTDVFVAGGGPAGLAAALALRAKGLRVIVADSATPLIDKPCGEGLMPDSVAVLAQLGIRIERETGFPFRGIRFLGDAVSVEAEFPMGSGIGIRRTALHGLLIDKAAEAGVDLRWGARVTGIEAGAALLNGERVRARWVVGADGQNSRVRLWAGLDRYRRESRRFGFRRHYRIAPWTDCMEIYWCDGCQFYVTPSSSEEVCVAVISRDPHLRIDRVLDRAHSLIPRLKGAVPATSERGAVSATRRLKRVAKGSVALIGDASGSVDAVTGDGLCLAFRQASALADALVTGRLEDYQSAHNRLFRRPALMGDLMLLLDRFPWLRRRVLPAFAANPAIFSKMLAMHVGAITPVDFAFEAILPLSWGMLQP